MTPCHSTETGLTALGVVLLEMSRWQAEEGRAVGVVRCSREVLELIAGEAEVWPVGPREDGYLSRVPGVPAEFMVDPLAPTGYVVHFEGLPFA